MTRCGQRRARSWARKIVCQASPILTSRYPLPTCGPAGATAACRFGCKCRASGAPWCRESRPDESDGLRLWIDTRDTHNIHRASRFCHQFIFLPSGSGRNLGDPYGELYFINRARENPKAIRHELLKSRSEKRVDGYVLEAHIPAAAITGWDPAEHAKLGFTYAVVDQELGEQTFSCGKEFPYRDDPSVWGTLELVSRSSDRRCAAWAILDFSGLDVHDRRIANRSLSIMPSTWPNCDFFVFDRERLDEAAARRRRQVDRHAVGQQLDQTVPFGDLGSQFDQPQTERHRPILQAQVGHDEVMSHP